MAPLRAKINDHWERGGSGGGGGGVLSSNHILHRKSQNCAKTQRYSEKRSFSKINAKVLAQKSDKIAVFYRTILAHFSDTSLAHFSDTSLTVTV